MGAARRVRSTVALLGILALAGKLLAGAFCLVPAQASSAAAGVVDPILGILSLCVSGDHAAPTSGGGPAPEGAPDHCGACTLLAGLALLITLLLAAIAFPARLERLRLLAGVRTLADHLSLGGVRSRAPPLAA